MIKRILVALSFVALSACHTVHFSRNPEALIPRMPAPKKPINYALVLGAGGARGLAHVGVLEVLEEEGLIPDLIIGCSAGAIVGGLYASRKDAKWLREALLPKKSEHFLSLEPATFPFALVSNMGLENYLSDMLGDRRFQDLLVPFVAVATNLQTGRLHTFYTGPLVKPIMASSAVPGAFYPVELYDTYFVDGGVADPVPVQTARDLKARVVVAVEVGQQLSNKAPSNMLDIMWRSLTINFLALSKQNVRQADVAIEVPVPDLGMFSDEQNWDLYVLGRLSAQAAVPKIKALLQKSTQHGDRK